MMDMKSAICIAVRTKSTRLPQKALLNIMGKTAIEHLIDRLKLAKLPNMIVLCTSTSSEDDVLIKIAEKNGINYFRGSECDKLERFLGAADKYNLDFIVCVDGDDLFCDPEYIDKIIEVFVCTQADYITCRELPIGVTAHGIKVEALRKVCNIKDETDTEVYEGYFTETGLFKVEFLKVEDEILRHPEIRMTLDYQEDYEFFKKIFEELYKPGYVFSLKEIMTLLFRKKTILEINKNAHKKYTERIKKQTKIKIKKNYYI